MPDAAAWVGRGFARAPPSFDRPFTLVAQRAGVTSCPGPRPPAHHPTRGRHAAAALAVLLIVLLPAVVAAPAASAHGFSSTVYVDVTTGDEGAVRTTLDLEYDLLVVSAGTAGGDTALVGDGSAAFRTGREASVLNAHADAVVGYVTGRFAVTGDGSACPAVRVGPFAVHERDGVPYATLVLDHACPRAAAAHEVTSTLFPDAERFVRDVKTVVTYDVDGRRGSAALDAAHPRFVTQQSGATRFTEFFRLGAEHLLGGLDHLLFLLALIVGSRRVRDVVAAATAFTAAHSVTFLLAALGAVHVSAALVEPAIALSIAFVAGWYLWRLRAVPAPRGLRGADAVPVPPVPVGRVDRLGMDRADRLRLAVVLAFGLVHGLGFAGALGIDEPMSWTLLWSLLVFNLGIEAVQLGIIAVVFPVLLVLRRRAPRVATLVGAGLAAGVCVVGLWWFVQRVNG